MVTKNKPMKLICINPGHYRSENGSVRIICIPGRELPWVAMWRSFTGSNKRRFATLAEARKAVS